MEHFKNKETGEIIKAVYHWDTWSASEIVTMLIGDECEAHLEEGVLFIYDQPMPYGVYIALDVTGVRCITKSSIETHYIKVIKPDITSVNLKDVSIVFDNIPRIYQNLDDYMMFLNNLKNSVPEQHHKNIIISVESVDDSELTLNIWFKRPETPEEAQVRIDKQKILEVEQRERDLKELKRIVDRYNIKSIDDFMGDKNE